MRIGKPQTFARQAIEIRRADSRRSVTADITIPQVVCIEEHNIRRFGVGLRTRGQDRNEGDEGYHAGGSNNHSVAPDRDQTQGIWRVVLHPIMVRLLGPSKGLLHAPGW